MRSRAFRGLGSHFGSQNAQNGDQECHPHPQNKICSLIPIKVDTLLFSSKSMVENRICTHFLCPETLIEDTCLNLMQKQGVFFLDRDFFHGIVISFIRNQSFEVER